MKKYLANGQEVHLIEELKSGFLVQNIMCDEDYEGCECYETVDEYAYVVKQIFDKAPTAKYDEKIAILNDEVTQLNETVCGIKRKINEYKLQLEKYKKYEQLKRLDDFLEHKITHYADLDYSPDIVAIGDAKCSYYHDRFKLLTLYGDTKGNLQWKINDYSDGSGYYKDVIPCISLNEAKEKLQKFIDSKVDDKHPSSSVIKAAKKWNLVINPDYVKRFKENDKIRVMKEIESHKQKINKLEDELKVEA